MTERGMTLSFRQVEVGGLTGRSTDHQMKRSRVIHPIGGQGSRGSHDSYLESFRTGTQYSGPTDFFMLE